MASARDREAWSQIFKLYKGFPHLWDKNNINYGNRSMTTDGYKLLTRVYRDKLDKQASVGALRMKMKNLRTTYYRELRKIKEAKEKSEKYTPSLWYFEHLNFLGSPRTCDSATDASQNDNVADSPEMQNLAQLQDTAHMDDLALENSDMEFDFGSSTSQSKNINSPVLERPDYIIEFAQNSIKDEHWEVIGKSIGYQLKDLNKKQYTIVSKLISDAIYFGRLNKLSEASHIEVGPSSYRAAHPRSPHYSTHTPSVHYNMGYHAVDVPTDQMQSDRFKHEETTNED